MNSMLANLNRERVSCVLAGLDSRRWFVYVDGACSNNGRPDAVAGIGVYIVKPDNTTLEFSAPLQGDRQTNQRAELSAIRAAFSLIKDELPAQGLYVITDSMYSINSIEVWSAGWSEKGWPSTIRNLDLIRPLIRRTRRIRRTCPLDFIHVRGHSGVEGNEIADKLAVKGCTER